MQENLQRPEPADKGDGSTLDLHSIFQTIQGEGPFTGKPAVFVRLAGCNLQCPWCDTEYTDGRREKSVEDIVMLVLEARARHTKLVVITGGEPLRQNIAKLCSALVLEGLTVQIESNGVFGVSKELSLLLKTPFVHLVVSPKTSKVHSMIHQHAMAFKYVLQAGFIDADDGLPTLALGHKAAPKVARPPAEYTGAIFVNPMDSKDAHENLANLSAALHSSLKFGYTIGVQLHKLLEVE